MDTPQSGQQPQQSNPVTSADSGNNEHTMIIIGYVFPILFFLNMKGNAKFHGNQQLVLLLAAIVSFILNMILAFIPVIGWLIGLALSIFILVLWIIGIINGVQNQMKQLPVIGGITILK